MSPEVERVSKPTSDQIAWGEPAIEFSLLAEGFLEDVKELGGVFALASIVEFAHCDRESTAAHAVGDPNWLPRYYQATFTQTFGFTESFRATLAKLEFEDVVVLSGTSQLTKQVLARALSRAGGNVDEFLKLVAEDSPTQHEKAFRVFLQAITTMPYHGVLVETLDEESESPSWAWVVGREGSVLLSAKGVRSTLAKRPLVMLGDDGSEGLKSFMRGFCDAFLRDPAYQNGKKEREPTPGVLLCAPCWQHLRKDGEFEGAFLGWLFIRWESESVLLDHVEGLLADVHRERLRPLLNQFANRVAEIEARSMVQSYARALRIANDLGAPLPGPIDYFFEHALLFDGWTVGQADNPIGLKVVHHWKHRSDSTELWLAPTPLVQGTFDPMPVRFENDLRGRIHRLLDVMGDAYEVTSRGQLEGRMKQMEEARDATGHELHKLLPLVASGTPSEILDEIRSFFWAVTAPEKAVSHGSLDGSPVELFLGATLESFVRWQMLLAMRMQTILGLAKSRDGRREDMDFMNEQINRMQTLSVVDALVEFDGFKDFTLGWKSQKARVYCAFAVIAALRNAIHHLPEGNEDVKEKVKVSVTHGVDGHMRLCIRNRCSHEIARDPPPSGGTKTALKYFVSKYRDDPEVTFGPDAEGTEWLTVFDLPPSVSAGQDRAPLGEWNVMLVDDSPSKTRHVAMLLDLVRSRLPHVTLKDGWAAEDASASADDLRSRHKLLRSAFEKAVRGETNTIWLIDIDLPWGYGGISQFLRSPKSPPGPLGHAHVFEELMTSTAMKDVAPLNEDALKGPDHRLAAILIAGCQKYGLPWLSVSTRGFHEHGVDGVQWGRSLLPSKSVAFPQGGDARTAALALSDCVNRIADIITKEDSGLRGTWDYYRKSAESEFQMDHGLVTRTRDHDRHQGVRSLARAAIAAMLGKPGASASAEDGCACLWPEVVVKAWSHDLLAIAAVDVCFFRSDQWKPDQWGELLNDVFHTVRCVHVEKPFLMLRALFKLQSAGWAPVRLVNGTMMHWQTTSTTKVIAKVPAVIREVCEMESTASEPANDFRQALWKLKRCGGITVAFDESRSELVLSWNTHANMPG